jgi:hypothetical protein
MQPKITAAEHQISFKLATDYTASVYTEVKSTGLMQYLHFLVVHGPDKQPLFFVCAEWFDEITLANSGPVLGVFSSMGHENIGSDRSWLDIDLFVLNAIQVAMQELELEDDGINDGEAWALTHVLKKVQRLDGENAPQYLADAYLQTISKNDARLAAYLQRFNVH